MTTIMGIWRGDKAWLAGDRRVTGENHLYASSVNRIHTRQRQWQVMDEYRSRVDGIGFSGSHAGSFLTTRAFDAADRKSDVFTVTLGMLETLRTHPDKELNVSALMIWNKELYDVDTKGAPTPIKENVLWARGSGEDYAMGAGDALKFYVTNPMRLLEHVYLTVEKFDLYTGGGLQIEEFDLSD